MHPRNIYRSPPDFKQLAIKYAEFRKFAVQDLSGKVHISFKDPNALRALTQTLLKKDFGLDVEIPVDRLIPTIPQRLNYLLWVEDLLKNEGNKTGTRRGIDIGTGASCVFPLLGSSMNDWHFLATETDQASYECATRNVQNNKLQDKVKVVHVSESCSLQVALSEESAYDFCMCNPPFFCDSFDASWEAKSRKKNRDEPKGANTASAIESITQGGEIEFVKKIIADSLLLKERIKIYTTMLGKKVSVASIKEHLKEKEVPHFITTEFQQGKTLRWGVAWTFSSNIKLSKISVPKTNKPVKPLSFFVPSTLKCVEYTVSGVAMKITELIKELDILYHVYEQKDTKCKLWMRTNRNTWSHQRRKKRELMRQKMQSESSTTEPILSNEIGNLTTESSTSNTVNGLEETSANPNLTMDELCRNGTKRKLSEVGCENTEEESVKTVKTNDNKHGGPSDLVTRDDNKWLLFADVHIILTGRCISLEFKARKEMDSRETLHQIMQFFKNKLI